MKKKKRTHQQRWERMRAAVQIAAVIVIVLLLEFGCAQAAGAERPIGAEAYLSSINASNQSRAEMQAVWGSWEDED